MDGYFFCRLLSRSGQRRMIHGLAGLLLGLAALSSGCQAPYTGLIQGENGPVRLSEITAITQDTNLTDDQKRQALEQLGITDPNMVDVLIRGLST